MNTNDVAQKWIQMCREGKNLDCINGLYAENVTSKEMPGMPGEIVSGKENVWNKNKEWLDNVAEWHGGEISEPTVVDNHFTTKMTFDITFKDRGRQHMEEVAVFEVNDGKIVNEQFFYNMG